MSSDLPPIGGTEARPDERRWVRMVPGRPAMLSQVDNVSYGAEQYRNLAFQVEQRKQQLGHGSLVVAASSPDPGAGKTLTSLNLALTLARESEQRVLLVEGDLWKPTFREYLEVDPKTPGLAQVLDGACTIDEAVNTIWGTSLDVLLAGEMGRRTGLMAHRRLSRAVEEMRAAYEVVVVDSPPIVLASGRALVSCADAVLAIVRSGKTKRRGIEEALTVIGPDKVLGFVLNAARPTSGRGYAYYSGYARGAVPGLQAEHDGRRRRQLGIVGGIVAAAVSIMLGAWLVRSEEPSVEDLVREAGSIQSSELGESAAQAVPAALPESSLLAGPGSAVVGARDAALAVRRYDISYVQLDYPGGDLGLDRGTAADLVVRAFRTAGLDLQQEIHEDLLGDPGAYAASEPDTSIDHRRVRNLMTYFERHGVRLDPASTGDLQPGDLVFWSTDQPGNTNHVGILSDRRSESGALMVIHHFKGSRTGSGAEEDALNRWPIDGLYRWTAAQEG